MTWRNGFKGSVTKACSGWVTIGTCTPAIRAISLVQPAVAETTTLVETSPPVVRTPVTRPSSTSIPVTSVSSWIRTPSRSA